MRYDAEHKQRTRAKVLAEAVAVIRQQGPAAVGVADVMKRAGLTHGGFYAHFDSREDMLLAAVGEMFADVSGQFEAHTAELEPADALRTYVRFYLSRGHRDAREAGCPLPILSSDLPRMGEPARRRFELGVAKMTGKLAGLLERLGRAEPQSLANSALSEMIGALVLARAVADPVQSKAILDSSREAVLARFGLAAA